MAARLRMRRTFGPALEGWPMARRLCFVLLLASWSWGVDQEFPGILLHPDPPRPLLPPEDGLAPPLPLVIPFGQRLTLTWIPFAGSGPFHFENLSASPYYAHVQDVEFGVRLGFDLALDDRLHLGLQLPYIYNPAPLAAPAPGPLTLMNDQRHLDLAIGISWFF
jgi:hypothetical protein